MEQLIHLNNGMNQDVDPSLQPDGTYRFGLNGTLINQGGNKYAFESVKGTISVFSLPGTSDWFLNSNQKNTYLIPIGLISLGDKLVVFSTSPMGDSEIGLVTFNDKGTGIYETKYHDVRLNFSKSFMIRGYGLIENDAYHRVYWTDGNNQPRTINLAASILNTQVTSFVNGQKYMVLKGTVSVSGKTYGILYNDSNIYTYDSSLGYTYSFDVKIIKYLDYKVLGYIPEKQVGVIDYSRTSLGGDGNLWTGVNRYCYRLYTNDGYYSQWTPLSNFIHITSKLYAGISNTLQSYQSYEGDRTKVNSQKSISLRLSNIDTFYNKIQVGVFESHDSVNGYPNQSIDASYIFYDGNITGEVMYVSHRGQENLGTLQIADIAISNNVNIKTCEDIVTIKQRQIQLNLKGRQELTDYNTTGATLEVQMYKLFTDEIQDANGFPASFYHKYFSASGYQWERPDKILIPYLFYYVASGSINYGGVKNAGTVFQASWPPAPYSGSGTVLACIARQKYIKQGTSQPEYDIKEIYDEWYDYKSPAIQKYCKGYWRDETYRLGAMFYDEFGIPFAVKPLGDIKIPKQSDGYPLSEYKPWGSSFHLTYLNAMSIIVNNLDITDIKDKVRGVSIVRCERDATILGQGVLIPFSKKRDSDPNQSIPFIPVGYPLEGEPQKCYNEGLVIRSRDLYGFLCPEFDYQYQALGSGMSAFTPSDKIISTAKLSRAKASNPNYSTQVVPGSVQYVYDKLYIHGNAPTRESNVQGIARVEQGQEPTVIGAYIRNYDIPTRQDIKRVGVGGAKYVMRVTPFQNYGSGNYLMAVNYVRPKSQSSLYGGTSDAALANNQYISTGHYLKIDSQVLNDIYNPATKRYVLNGMQVFGGDAFVCLYDRMHVISGNRYHTTDLIGDGQYNKSIYSWNGTGHTKLTTGLGSWAYGMIFPVESNINISLREGVYVAKSGIDYNVLVHSTDPTKIKKETFIYNTAISSANSDLKYYSLPINFKSVNKFPFRVRYSNAKNLGEEIDNMRIFPASQFRDVDSLHGEIVGGIVVNDRFFIFQQRGVSFLSVEERAAIGTNILGAPIQLGVAGILDRPDVVDKFYGTQHKFSIYSAENHIGFFDFRRKAWVAMTFNGGTTNLNKIMGMDSFFNNAFKDSEEKYSDIFNRQDIANGYGITAVFDSKHKMALMTFKFKDKYEKQRGFTIGMNIDEKTFVSFYSFIPSLYVEHNNKLYSTGINDVPQMSTGYYKKGDIAYAPSITIPTVVGSGTVQLITIKPLLHVAIKDTYVPSDTWHPWSANPSDWKMIFSNNQIPDIGSLYLHWVGDICRFYGLTYNFELETVFTGSIGRDFNHKDAEKSFDVMEVYGNDTAFTDVYYEDSKRIAKDENIQSTNKNFRYIDNSWWFNTALSNGKERMVDHYIKMKIVVKNYKNDITESLNKLKRVVYLKTIYRTKK